MTEESPDRVTALDAEANPTPKPAGSPALWPFLKLPRRQRAKFVRDLKPLTDRINDLQAMSNAENIDIGSAADALEMYADLEDLLKSVAVDQAAYETWAVEAPDGDLLGLFGWYIDRFQVGEAQASPH